MSSRDLRISQKMVNRLLDNIIIIAAMIVCIKPAGIAEIVPSIEFLVYTVGSGAVVLIVLGLLVVYCIKNRKIPYSTLVWFSLYAFIVFNTVLHDGPVYASVLSWFPSVGLIGVFEVYNKRFVFLMRAMRGVLFTLSLINLFCMILYPDGMYITSDLNYTDCWLLGYKSSFQYYFFPLVTIALLFAIYRNEWVSFVLVMLIVHIETFMSGNMMFAVVIVALDIFVLLRLYANTTLFNTKTYSLVILGVNLAFIFFFTVIMETGLLSYLVFTLLGKSSSIFSRLRFWEIGLEMIAKKPILGYGYLRGEDMVRYIKVPQAHLHNQWLQLLLQGGVVELALFALYVQMILKKLKKNISLVSSQLLLLMLFLLFLSVVVEVFTLSTSVCIWPIFILAYYTEEVDRQMKARKKKKIVFIFGKK